MARRERRMLLASVDLGVPVNTGGELCMANTQGT